MLHDAFRIRTHATGPTDRNAVTYMIHYKKIGLYLLVYGWPCNYIGFTLWRSFTVNATVLSVILL